MISCDEATIICNKSQYKEASFVEKIQLKIHLFYCKTCLKYVKKNKRLTAIFQKTCLHSLSDEEKIRMKQQLHDEF